MILFAFLVKLRWQQAVKHTLVNSTAQGATPSEPLKMGLSTILFVGLLLREGITECGRHVALVIM